MRHLLALMLLSATLLSVAVSRADAAEVRAPELDDIATVLTGFPVTVECFPIDPDSNLAGYVYPGTTVIHLHGALCGALVNTFRNPEWMTGRNYAFNLVGMAVLVLTHEATHLALDSGDEGLVECTAYRNVYNAIKQLPLDWRARQLVYQQAKWFHGSRNLTGPYRTYC